MTAALLLAAALAAPVSGGEGAPVPWVAITAGAESSSVVTDSIWSRALGTWKRFVVYLPPSYGTGASRYPSVYYLHGWSGNERNWLESGRIRETLDSLARAGVPEMVVVMPDGDDSWYTTWNALNDPRCARDTARAEGSSSYCVPWPHYDDYLAHELVALVDRRYRTIAAAASRGIAGLSMGGYGGLALALAYPRVFGAGASHSGVVWPMHTDTGAAAAATGTAWARRASFYRQILPSLELAFGRDTIGWRTREPGALLARRALAREPMPALWLDCGVNDQFIGQNRRLHALLTRERVAHEWHERPGGHTWSYWRDNVPHSLRWFAGILAR